MIPTQTDCNWVKSYEMKYAQAENDEEQILIDCVNNIKPELGKIRLPLSLPGVLYYEWFKRSFF